MPSSFLRPDAEEQAQLRAKQDEAARKKKAEAKVRAEERKRKRDADKERVAAIKEEIESKRAAKEQRSAPPPPRDAVEARAAARIDTYLAKGPFMGVCSRADKDTVKQICGPGNYVFDGSGKPALWGTRLVGYIEPLINSRCWMPYGIEEEWLPRLIDRARERTADEMATAEARSMVKQENATPVAGVAKEEKDEEARTNADDARDHLTGRHARTREQVQHSLREAGTDAEIRECRRLGFTEETVLLSPGFGELGPVAGLSWEGRLLRWIGFERVDARHDHAHDPDVYFDPIKLQPLLDARDAQVVRDLNARARRLASSGA